MKSILGCAFAFAISSVTVQGRVVRADDNPWIGHYVMDKKGATISVDGQDAFRLIRWPALVTAAKDSRLCVGSGWIDEQHVVRILDAEAYYSEYIRRNPTDAWGYVKRAVVFDDLGQLDNASWDFKIAIERDDTSVDAHNGRGNVFRKKRQFDEAIDDFTAAIRLDPRDPRAFIGRGDTFRDKGNDENAIADYSEAIRLDPKNEDTYLSRAFSFHRKGELDKAIADCTETIRLNPRNRIAFTSRGTTFRLKGEYDKSFADWTEAIRLDPKDYFTLSRRAWLRATCPDAKYRDGAAAIDDATKACELSKWKSFRCTEALAAAYAETAEFDRAIEYQQKAIAQLGSNEKIADELREHLELFKQKLPVRDPKMRSSG